MQKPFHLLVNYRERVFGLDFMRAVAVLLVVLSHFDRLLGQHYNYTPATRWVFNHVFVFFIDGVDLFFVLSGYLIGGILLKILEKEPTFSWKIVFHFWKRRWYRTLPNYYLVLFLNFLLWAYLAKEQGLFNGRYITDAQLFKYLFFFQNLYQPCPPFFVESWSLAIEEWFYLLLPVVLMGVFRSKNWGVKRGIVVALFCIFIGSTLFKISLLWPYFYTSLSPFDAGNTYRTVVLARLDTLMFGVAGAWVHRYYPSFWQRYKGYALALGIGLVYYLRLSATDELNTGFRLLSGGFHSTVLSFAVLCMLPAASAWRQQRFSFFTRVITYISLVSYSVYLLNLLIIKAITEVIYPNLLPSITTQGIVCVAYWGLLMGASALLYQYYEKPMTDRRDVV